MTQPPPIPTFETWKHENLVSFAFDAHEKMQEQRDLIHHLRQLVMKNEESDDARKTD